MLVFWYLMKCVMCIDILFKMFMVYMCVELLSEVMCVDRTL